MSIAAFNLFLGVMSLIALIVFIALYFVKAGYGIFRTASWGAAISNKLAWVLMEAPVFLVMCWMWMHSERRFDPVILTFFVFFQIHYFQRAFVFPLLLTGKSKMPLAIMSMGILFNLLNGYMQGEWIFYLAAEGMYHSGWFTSAWFITGSLLPVSKRNICEKLPDISVTTVEVELGRLLKSGEIEKIGTGRGTKYRAEIKAE